MHEKVTRRHSYIYTLKKPWFRQNIPSVFSHLLLAPNSLHTWRWLHELRKKRATPGRRHLRPYTVQYTAMLKLASQATARRHIPVAKFRMLSKTVATSQEQSPAESPAESASEPEVKSAEQWSSGTYDDYAITRKVVGLAKRLQEQSKPPVEIANSFQKNFLEGNMYDPFDFSMRRVDMDVKLAKQARDKFRSYNKGKGDLFEKAGINPLDLYTMPDILSKFVSQTGQVLPREVTGCNSKNQRLLGMAIKRAISVGLMSSTNKHQEVMPRRLM